MVSSPYTLVINIVKKLQRWLLRTKLFRVITVFAFGTEFGSSSGHIDSLNAGLS